MWAFLGGVFVGAVLGFITLALCLAAGKNRRDDE